MSSENYINHVALVLDSSSSMRSMTKKVIQVADEQVAYLAKRSTELDQETRITLYSFADLTKCMVYDKDALRLPSVAKFYRPDGMTALLDAVDKAIADLEKTAQLYGNHAFLIYVLTDGAENRSRNITSTKLRQKLDSLPENWTVALLVPEESYRDIAVDYGFPRQNIAVWETTEDGLTEASNTILRATNAYMTARSTGVHGTKTLFSTGADALNKATVKDAKLKPIPKGTYEYLHVTEEMAIKEFVNKHSSSQYLVGKAFYQLTKTENIQQQKQVAVRNKKSGRFYTGPQARDLLGLPDMNVRVKPDMNPEYEVFVQSTSVNRKLLVGTKLLVLD